MRQKAPVTVHTPYGKKFAVTKIELFVITDEKGGIQYKIEGTNTDNHPVMIMTMKDRNRIMEIFTRIQNTLLDAQEKDCA